MEVLKILPSPCYYRFCRYPDNRKIFAGLESTLKVLYFIYLSSIEGCMGPHMNKKYCSGKISSCSGHLLSIHRKNIFLYKGIF